MSDTSEDGSSDVSSIYKSDEADVIKSFISYPDNDTNYPPDTDGFITDAVTDCNKYRSYTDLRSFKIDASSGTQVFPRQAKERLTALGSSVISRLQEKYPHSFIYISSTLMTDLVIQSRMRIPPRVLCDVFVVSPFQPVGVFTFLLDDADTAYDPTYLAYNSHIARIVTSTVRDNSVMNFSLVHGVFDAASYGDPSRFSDKLQHFEERAYLIGMKSCMDLDTTTCDSVIQTFVDLMFDFQDPACATVAMVTACKDGNLQLVKDIISVSPETVNTPSEHGDTPLMWASLGGHYDVVMVLLSHKTDVNVKNNRGETSLLMACRKSLLHKTIDRGKERNITLLGCILAGDLHVSVDKTSDENEIYTNIVELLLSHGADENVADNDDFTPLILTCIFGDLGVTELLLSRGVNVDYTGILGSTALMWACVFGHDNIVDRLIQAGADVNLKANLNISALHISSYFCREKIVDKLISHGANVDEADDNEYTPVWFAALFGFLNVVNLLTSHGAQIDKPDCNGVTPLMAASASGQSGVVETLISQGGDVNHQDTGDMTHLMWSALSGHTDTVRLLLSHGAKIDARDVNGTTAFMWACIGGWDDVLELLLANGADVNVTDENGHTPLTFVCRNIQNIYELLFADDDDDGDDDDDIAANILYWVFFTISKPQSLENHLNQLKAVCSDRTQIVMFGFAHLTADTDLLSLLQRVFSDHHTDTPSVTTDDGDTRHDRVLKMLLSRGSKKDVDSALLVACQVGYESGVRLLLQHGAYVNIHNDNDDTALTIASEDGLSDIVELLLDLKADVNAKGNDGDTPLIAASREGHDTVVEILLRHGADVTISNNDGETAATVAEDGGHDTVVDILLKHQAGINTGEKVSSVSQKPRTDLSLQHPENVDTAEEEEKDLERKTDDNVNTDVNVTSNKMESKKKKGSKKGPGLRLKIKEVDKAREIFRQALCKVS